MSEALYKLALITMFVPLVISLILFPFLPEIIPTHFTGVTPDAWSKKWSVTAIMGLFMIPLISIIMCGLLYRGAPFVYQLAKDNDQTLKPRTWAIIILIFAVVFLIAQLWIVGLIISNI